MIMLQTMFLFNREELFEAKKKLLEWKSNSEREKILYGYFDSLILHNNKSLSFNRHDQDNFPDGSNYIYPKEMIKILRHCLNNDSNERPSFNVLLILILEV